MQQGMNLPASSSAPASNAKACRQLPVLSALQCRHCLSILYHPSLMACTRHDVLHSRLTASLAACDAGRLPVCMPYERQVLQVALAGISVILFTTLHNTLKIHTCAASCLNVRLNMVCCALSRAFHLKASKVTCVVNHISQAMHGGLLHCKAWSNANATSSASSTGQGLCPKLCRHDVCSNALAGLCRVCCNTRHSVHSKI